LALRARRAENKKAHTGVAVWAFTLSRYRAGGLLNLFSSCGFGFWFFHSNALFWVCQIDLLMFGFRILGLEWQIFISCGFWLRFFNSNVTFWVFRIELLLFISRILGFELQILSSCGFGFGFSWQSNRDHIVRLSFFQVFLVVEALKIIQFWGCQRNKFLEIQMTQCS